MEDFWNIYKFSVLAQSEERVRIPQKLTITGNRLVKVIQRLIVLEGQILGHVCLRRRLDDSSRVVQHVENTSVAKVLALGGLVRRRRRRWCNQSVDRLSRPRELLRGLPVLQVASLVLVLLLLRGPEVVYCADREVAQLLSVRDGNLWNERLAGFGCDRVDVFPSVGGEGVPLRLYEYDGRAWG